ncbi:dimethyl sulfoxide reductase anchor subunit family protein [Dongia soli]|uniref:DmsC/YnfH family molybdoenzyme membrane anchor subunit n=1 Tax=Dongia soli TaxID=600628 RepID=A0ABU5EGF7_9PROT|nr:DmsC/YnfH family molybdoenzyme membrane anchor subunit [Dongia soli]MDY0885210.1 DmsC/YnfH family molybdoenzyme membrane anchor subunit [Dongia soli]
MHPAYSVIFFTSASGGGYGLLFWLGLLGAGSYLPTNRWFAVFAFTFALLMVSAGLVASTFHLGRPERAWRAFSQWRSSWLSREGVMSLVTYMPAGLMAIVWILYERILSWVGLLLCLCTLLTILCTAMIYASLKPIRRWRHPLTPVGYLMIGLGSGALWLSCFTRLFDGGLPCAWIAFGMLLVGAAVKLLYWQDIDHERPVSTAATATGLGDPGKVRLFAAPHTSENYLQREMAFQIGRKHAGKLRRWSLVAGFLVPALLALLSRFLPTGPAMLVLLLAVISNGIGVLVERWLFFAEARHTVTLYYGADAA